MLFLRRTAILKKELQYERSEGPSLRLLGQLSHRSTIFQVATHAPIAELAQPNQFEQITVRKDPNSNVRALYLSVLLLAHRQNSQTLEGELPLRLKEYVYNDHLRLPCESSTMSSSLLFSSQENAKKVFAQLLQTLLHGKEPVWGPFNRMPCLDELMTVVVRHILYRERSCQPNLYMEDQLSTNLLFGGVCRILNIALQQQPTGREWTLGNQIVVRQTVLGDYSIIPATAPSLSGTPTQDRRKSVHHHESPESPKERRYSELSSQQRFGALLDPRTVISEESNSIQSDHELSDIIERYECQSGEFSPLSLSQKENIDLSNIHCQEPSIQIFRLNHLLKDEIKQGFRKDKPGDCEYKSDVFQVSQASGAPFDIFDGMTGEEVIKIMSPRHVNSLNQRKLNSVLALSSQGLEQARILRSKIELPKNTEQQHPSANPDHRFGMPMQSRENSPQLGPQSSKVSRIGECKSSTCKSMQFGPTTLSRLSPRASNVSPNNSSSRITPDKPQYLSTMPVCFTYHSKAADSRRIFGDARSVNRQPKIIQFSTPMKPSTPTSILKVTAQPVWNRSSVRQSTCLGSLLYPPHR